jgi:pyruvate dehydrogenase E1 component
MSTQTNDVNDIDPIETQEWLDALSSVLESEGTERAHFLLENLVKYTRRRGVHLPFDATTAYLNTIPVGKEQKSPGNQELEHRIRSIIRWNAAAMVLRAGKKDLELGGHIASFQSAATLYDVGFNHFWHAKHDDAEGDLVFIQGHSAPGIYARAFVEGRLSEDELNNFRQEVDGKGLSSYPHPHLMPDFWQFPTVSMGLGPLMAIYQARFLKYLESRGLTKTKGRKVWVFCGDGEMDEPESQGAISLAAREGLDNLIFVINCNLQRLGRPCARQRQDYSRAGRQLPRRRLECAQSDLGQPLGCALGARYRQRICSKRVWMNASTAIIKPINRKTALMCAIISSTPRA